MTSGVVVLVAALLLVVAVATARADVRFRGGRSRDELDDDPGPPGGALAAHLYLEGITLGERATLLQLSSAFCAPCRATRVILADAADLVPGVVHVEIDAESDHLLVRLLGIFRTPTTLILDARGREVGRAVGVPKRDEVLTTLARVTAR